MASELEVVRPVYFDRPLLDASKIVAAITDVSIRQFLIDCSWEWLDFDERPVFERIGPRLSRRFYMPQDLDSQMEDTALNLGITVSNAYVSAVETHFEDYDYTQEAIDTLMAIQTRR